MALHKKIVRSRQYPAQNITNADYADDITLLVNTLTKSESRPHSREQAAKGIDVYVNANKTEHMGFNQKGDILTLNGVSLKQHLIYSK